MVGFERQILIYPSPISSSYTYLCITTPFSAECFEISCRHKITLTPKYLACFLKKKKKRMTILLQNQNTIIAHKKGSRDTIILCHRQSFF